MWWNRTRNLGAILTCADWRLHRAGTGLNRRLARQLGVDGLGMTALPGPDGLLLPGRESQWQAVCHWTKVLVDSHHAKILAVVAHQKCLGHPVSNEEHETDAVTVAKALKAAIGYEGPAAALVAVHHTDLKWDFKLLARC